MPDSDAEVTRPRSPLVPMALLALAGGMLRIWEIGADEGWFDELYSVIVASLPPSELIGSAIADQTNPPGAYLLFHWWSALSGQTLIGMRAFTVLCGTLTAPVVFAAGRALGFSQLAAFTGGALVAGSPQLIRMSLEVRAYAPLALGSAVALWIAALVLRGEAAADDRGHRRATAALSLTHVVLVMLHYFGAFSVAAHTLAILAVQWRRDVAGRARAIRTAVTLALPAVLALGTWLWVVMRASSDREFGENVAPNAPVHPAVALARLPSLLIGDLATGGLRVASMGVLLVALLAVVVAARTNRPDDSPTSPHARSLRFVLFAAVLAPLLALTADALVEQQIWTARYLTGMLPALALLVAAKLSTLRVNVARSAATVMIAWSAVAGTHSLLDRPRKPDWSQLITTLAPQGGEAICVSELFTGLPFLYHARAVGREDVRVVTLSDCRPSDGLAWLVYRGEPAPVLSGADLGPRVVLFRGQQNLDARRIAWPVAQ